MARAEKYPIGAVGSFEYLPPVSYLGDHLVEVCVDLVTRFLHTFARAEKLPSSCAVGMRSRTFRKLV